MSFNDDITLTTAANPAGTVFSKVIESQNQVIRRDPTASIAEPSDLRIASTRSSTRQQTAVIRSIEKTAADLVTIRRIKASLKLDFPIDTTFSASEIDEVVEEVCVFTLASLVKLRNGEK